MADSDAPTTVLACLAAVGLSITDLHGKGSLTDEFATIKKAYFRGILVAHPDKGGDEKEFRLINTSFELLRLLFEKQDISSFSDEAEASKERFLSSGASRGASARSWQFYYDAGKEEMPGYRVELAKSGRSACVQKSCPKDEKPICMGQIRVGSLIEDVGSYGRWNHLSCWRVPSRIWQGLEGCNNAAEYEVALASMNEVVLCGFEELLPQDKARVVKHTMNKQHWAKLVKGKKIAGSEEASQTTAPSILPDNSSVDSSVPPSLPLAGPAAPSLSKEAKEDETEPSLAVSLSGGKRFYDIPKPGVNGAKAGFLSGKVMVLTGIFPEIGGGAGLDLGKKRLQTMCESFGARVTSSVSAKTDLLVVGNSPGMSKVSSASGKDNCQLINLADLTSAIEGKQSLSMAPKPEIETWSAGYKGNGLGGRIAGPKAPKAITNRYSLPAKGGEGKEGEEGELAGERKTPVRKRVLKPSKPPRGMVSSDPVSALEVREDNGEPRKTATRKRALKPSGSKPAAAKKAKGGRRTETTETADSCCCDA